MNWAYFQQLENNSSDTNLDLAQKYYEQALKVSGDLFEENDPELFGLYNAIGNCSAQQEHFEEADRYYRRALAMTSGEEVPTGILARSHRLHKPWYAGRTKG